MAIGDIGSVKDSLQWYSGDVYIPTIMHATGDIYILACGWGIFLKTMSIDSDGNIGDAVIDTLWLGSGLTSGCKGMVHVYGDVYAVAFITTANVVVETFTCDSAGNLGAAAIDTINLALDPDNKSYMPHIIHVTGNVFAVAYTDDADDGWIKTITINNDGSIDEPALDSWEFEPDRGTFPWLIHCGGTLYAVIVSSTSSNRGKIRTFTIEASGNITSLAKELLFETATNGFNGGIILPISGNNYVIIYQGPDSDGWAKTLTIADNGDISAVIDSWEWETFLAYWPHAVEVSENEAGDGKVYCVVFGTAGEYAPQVFTFEVLNNGTITKSKIDELTLVPGTEYVSTPSIVRVAYGIYAVAYEDTTGANSGQTKSFDVEEVLAIPVVTTNPATELGAVSATLNGTLDSDGGEACDCGFEWGLDTSYGHFTSTETKTKGQTFSQVIGGLEPGTTYHFRALATNSKGTGYGADRSFTTDIVVSRAYALAREEL